MTEPLFMTRRRFFCAVAATAVATGALPIGWAAAKIEVAPSTQVEWVEAQYFHGNIWEPEVVRRYGPGVDDVILRDQRVWQTEGAELVDPARYRASRRWREEQREEGRRQGGGISDRAWATLDGT